MIDQVARLDDERLDELHRANPVDVDSLPSSRSPEAAATLDRILSTAVDEPSGTKAPDD